jgi:hypothetical protein
MAYDLFLTVYSLKTEDLGVFVGLHPQTPPIFSLWVGIKHDGGCSTRKQEGVKFEEV